MSARGGQWVAAGVLVVVGVGIILYLTKKRKKTDPVSSKFCIFITTVKNYVIKA